MLCAHTVFPPSKGGKTVQRDVQPRPVFNQDEIGHRFKLGVLQQTLAIEVDILKQEHSEFAIDGKRIVLLTIFRDVEQARCLNRKMFTNHTVDDRPVEKCLRHIGVNHRHHIAINDRGLEVSKASSIKDLAGEQSCDNGFVLPQLSQHQIQLCCPVLRGFHGSEGAVAEFP